MPTNSITVEAIFEDGVLRPTRPLTLEPHQKVTLIVQMPSGAEGWPDDVAAIYQQIEAQDLHLLE